jgi:low affinity sulfate transporter 2
LQGRRNKKLFYLPAIAPLIAVVLSTLIVFLTKADKHGVKIIKHIEVGVNRSSAHQLQLNGPHVGQAAKVGLISAIIALTVCFHSSWPHWLYSYTLILTIDF